MTEQLNHATICEVHRSTTERPVPWATIHLNGSTFNVHCEITDWDDDYSTPITSLFVILAFVSHPTKSFKFYARTLDELVTELNGFERVVQHPNYFVSD